jgi:hypothetical protein
VLEDVSSVKQVMQLNVRMDVADNVQRILTRKKMSVLFAVTFADKDKAFLKVVVKIILAL